MALPAETGTGGASMKAESLGGSTLAIQSCSFPAGSAKCAMQSWATPTGKRRALGLEIPSSPTSSARSTL